MIYFFYLLTGLILILFQSLVVGFFLPTGLIYDLLIPFVVYLSLFHANGKSLSLIIFSGLIMDGITGGAFGIYMLTYFWIFMGIQLAVHFFQKDSPVLMFTAVVLGVCLEYGFVLTAICLSGKDFTIAADLTGRMIGRLILAGITGPLLLRFLRSLYDGKTAERNIS